MNRPYRADEGESGVKHGIVRDKPKHPDPRQHSKFGISGWSKLI